MISAPSPGDGLQDAARFRVGTLTYTKAGLVALFGWMLWGDFCFVLMEQIYPRLLPLQLKDLGASSFLIGLIVGTMPSTLHMFITPVVSVWSDRYRGPFGRRIPFLLWPSIPIVGFLLLMGYSREIGAYLSVMFAGGNTTAFTLVLLAVFAIGFQIFNFVVSSIYYYLFNDVIPEAFLGRFMALFRAVASGASFLFNTFIFGWAEYHMQAVYLSLALLYAVGFGIMCWRVREGEYAPPPPHRQDASFMDNVRLYFRECYTNHFYLFFFLATALWNVSISVQMFYIFFAKQIGMTAGQFGKAVGFGALLTALLAYPAGILVDRLHPLRMLLVGTALCVLSSSTFVMIVHDQLFFFIAYFGYCVALTVVAAAQLPTFMTLLPKERYGQFSSANMLVTAVATIPASAACGWFIDLSGGNYRIAFVWLAVFQALAFLALLEVIRRWKNHGGRDLFIPPVTWSDELSNNSSPSKCSLAS